MKRLFTIMLVCLSAVSCGTASKVSQEQTAQATVAVVDSLRLRREIQSALEETIIAKLTLEKAESLEMVTERFSTPDSTGATHLQEKTTLRYKGETKGHKATSVEKSVTASESVVKDSISTGETKSDYHEVISSEEAPAKTSRIPWIVRVLGWIGGFSVVFLALWVLRKFRVI